MERPIYLNLMWHMHQPYYRDPVTKNASMPWVRLHSIKDYLDMALLLEEYPKVKSTFNLVPSLVQQIEEYTRLGLSDRFLDLSRKPAHLLSVEERVEILKGFFMAQFDRMIKVHPRYHELFLMRGTPRHEREFMDAARRFSQQDMLDLQVWFNLAWFDPYLIENVKANEELRRLVKKNENYSEEDKQILLNLQIETMKGVIPAYQRLQNNGQIEVSVTPFYHPILPLLCDTDVARQALPHIALPSRRFAHPEDAKVQISRAAAFYKERFGMAPRGMWPSEGSVSEEALALIAEQGIDWVATDEEILAESTGQAVLADTYGHLENPGFLYQPYVYERNGKQIRMLFRDHRLSDRIGFIYSQWEAKAAANDLIDRLLKIQSNSQAGEHPYVSIILDGENAWEHFEKDGLYFFRSFYEALSNEPRIITMTPSDYLAKFPPKAHLSRIHAGSWINHNFRIWIGHEEDNLSWDYLGQARDDLTAWQNKHSGQAAQEKATLAWESIYIAEGSDWNWWYGDDHSSDNDEEFDRLYRLHLANVYEITGQEVPNPLLNPIPKNKLKLSYAPPVGFINPIIDGRESHYYEWLSAGKFETDKVGGSMHQAQAMLKSFQFGFDPKSFYIRLDGWHPFHAQAFPNLPNIRFGVKFVKPQTRLVKVSFQGQDSSPLLELLDEQEKPLAVAGTSLASDKILEMAIPFEVLGYQRSEEVRFLVLVYQDGSMLEYWPLNGPVSFHVPAEDFEGTLWSA